VTPGSVVDSFDQIVAGLDEDMICEHEEGCQNRVFWHIHYHGCGDYLLCDPHIQRWVQEFVVKLSHRGAVGCYSCGGFFTTIEGIAKLRPV